MTKKSKHSIAIRGAQTLAQIFLTLCTLAQKVGAEEYGLLPEYIKAIREECVQYVDTGVFKGERTTVYTTPKKDFFELGEGAIETHTVGNKFGRVTLYIVSRHKFLCAGSTMNDQCGASGCTYTLIANDSLEEIRGRKPQVVSAFQENILLIPSYHDNCRASSKETMCIEAWTWDSRLQALVTHSTTK